MDVNGDGTVVDCDPRSGGAMVGCDDNEMGFLYWEEGIWQLAPGPFNIQSNSYWSSTELASDQTQAWGFNFGSTPAPGANMVVGSKTTNRLLAWAVHDGDVGLIPVPAAVWLFGSGLLGLIGVATRKKSA